VNWRRTASPAEYLCSDPEYNPGQRICPAGKRAVYPTDLGSIVTELLVKNFPQVLDVAFTASLESQLDMIEAGKMKRLDTLNQFYLPSNGAS